MRAVSELRGFWRRLQCTVVVQWMTKVGSQVLYWFQKVWIQVRKVKKTAMQY